MKTRKEKSRFDSIQIDRVRWKEMEMHFSVYQVLMVSSIGSLGPAIAGADTEEPSVSMDFMVSVANLVTAFPSKRAKPPATR